jgi:hypothetical protein
MDFTWVLKTAARFRKAALLAQDPKATQEAQLRWLLSKAKDTEFGREHGFSSISSVSEYQSRVPLRTYEDFWNNYWKDSFPRVVNKTWPGLVPGFSWTSGTTSGKRKYVPYTVDLSKSYNKAGRDLLFFHVLNRPQSKVFGGKAFMLGGTTKLTEESEGVYIGEVSGFSAQNLPWWAKPFFFPPKELSDIPDWIKRADAIAEAIKGQDIRIIGGMPSWLLIFLERFSGAQEGLIHRLFPNLELFVHGGVNFDPYKKQYERLLKGSKAEFREIYPASEAFIAVADRGYGEGLRVCLDANVFYEFVPVQELSSSNPKRFWIYNVETDVNYAIVLSTPGGVWSYILGDTVRFIDKQRVLITGRTSYALSAFGEHLINEELEKGVSSAADSIGRSVSDFTVVAQVSANPGALGYHRYYVELDGETQEFEKFRDTLDKTLKDLNDDYLDHRAENCGVFEPEVVFLKRHTFLEWMKSRGKLGDQHKVARVLSKDLAKDLADFVEANQCEIYTVKSSKY